MSASIMISIRVPEEDLGLIDHNAERAGLSRTAWLIACARETGAGDKLRLKRAIESAQRALLDLAGELDVELVAAEREPAPAPGLARKRRQR